MGRAIGELDREGAALSCPGLPGLPHVGVEVGIGVVAQSAGAGRRRLLDCVHLA